jgi:Xaa-Pro aminopeptidase
VDCPLHGDTNHRIPVTQRAKHLAEVQEFRDTQEATAKDLDDLTNVFTRLGVTDDSPIDHLANVFTGLVVTDDGPDVRGQQHSKLFSSRDDFQDSLPDVPLGFQPLSPSEAISSIQSFVNSVPKRTALPTRKERRASTLADVLGRICTAQQSLDLVYELYAVNSDHDSVRLSLDAAAATVVAAGKLLRSVKASKNDKELAKMWDEVHAEALALDKLVDQGYNCLQEHQAFPRPRKRRRHRRRRREESGQV